MLPRGRGCGHGADTVDWTKALINTPNRPQRSRIAAEPLCVVYLSRRYTTLTASWPRTIDDAERTATRADRQTPTGADRRAQTVPQRSRIAAERRAESSFHDAAAQLRLPRGRERLRATSAERPELTAKRPPALIDAPSVLQRSRIAAEPLCKAIFSRCCCTAALPRRRERLLSQHYSELRAKC